MFDIIKLKSDIYKKRVSIEGEMTAPEILQHQLNRIKEGLIDMPFEDRGLEIITNFTENFKKLTQFLKSIDESMEAIQQSHLESGNITSVNQIKELFRNYEGVVLSQQKLLEKGINRMGEYPAPDQLAADLQAVSCLKDEDIDDYKEFLQSHQEILN